MYCRQPISAVGWIILRRRKDPPLTIHDIPEWAVAERLPRHVSIIMDGNGRWAQHKGLERTEGHREGTQNARRIVEATCRLGISHLTLYTFSRENWGRPKKEVSFIFDLLVNFMRKELPSLEEQGIKLNVLGVMEDLPLPARKALSHAIERTAKNSVMTLNLALNYSGREEIVRAAARCVADGLSPKEVTDAAIAERLWTAGQPDPDLMIRTSGEQRLSNYLLFQHAYSEFHFTHTYWPEFSVEEYHSILKDFANRQRRFGKTGEQMTR